MSSPSSTPALRAVLIAAQPPENDDTRTERSLAELEQLLLGLGITTAHRVVQRRSARASPTYLGEGKLREVAALTGGSGAVARGPASPVIRIADDLVVVADDELTPGQQRNLETALGVEVLDRTAVILRVFEARARTRDARLEVELARLEYELPRVRDDHTLGDREGGGGRASRGNTNVELTKQRTRDRIAALRRELDAHAVSAERRRAGRADVFRVVLVGYTNAGKSSLMRQLTGSDVLIEDKLFATLGTTVRPLSPPASPPVVVADTVGFIHRLPHLLLASFRSTLSEAREAWLLLHVADASDPEVEHQIAVTRQVLAEIGAADTPTALILNKADRLGHEARAALQQAHPEAFVSSAFDPDDGAALRRHIDGFFAAHLVQRTFVVPYARMGVLAELRPQLQVVREVFDEAITFEVRGTQEVVAKLASRLDAR